MLIGNKRVCVTMKDIIYCFFEKQKALIKLEKRTKEMEQRSRLKKEQEAKSEKWTFKVHPLLSGYLRGARGTNIAKVRRLNPNILSIKPQNGSCYISAKDKLSLNEAIDQLHIVCKKIIIPKKEMGQIIGAKGTQIQDIKAKSEVIKIISWKKWIDKKDGEFAKLMLIQTRVRNRYGNEYDEEGTAMDDSIPDAIKESTVDNIFDEESDIIDLSVGYDQIDEYYEDAQPSIKDDALVIIGRKSRVELCIFMIEMTLNHFRSISKTRNSMFSLRNQINELKGTNNRGRGRGRSGNRGGRGRGGRGNRGNQQRRGGRGAQRGRGRGYRRYNDEQYEEEQDDETAQQQEEREEYDDDDNVDRKETVVNGNYDDEKERSPANNRRNRGRGGKGRGNRRGGNRDRGRTGDRYVRKDAKSNNNEDEQRQSTNLNGNAEKEASSPQPQMKRRKKRRKRNRNKQQQNQNENEQQQVEQQNQD